MMNELCFKPFQESSDDDFNQVYTAEVQNGDNKKYKLEITIDGLNDGLILKESCTCLGNFFKKVECKHLKALKLELTKWNVLWRTEQLASLNVQSVE